MKVGYVTWGKLNAAKSNAILLVPGTSGNRHSYDAHIGPGKTFDTDKYFVIGADPIGGGTSSQPKDGLGTGFPQYTIRDMVRAQHEMIAKGLGDHSPARGRRRVDGLVSDGRVGDQFSRCDERSDHDRPGRAQRPSFRRRRGCVRGDGHPRSEVPGRQIHRKSGRRHSPRGVDLFPVDQSATSIWHRWTRPHTRPARRRPAMCG